MRPNYIGLFKGNRSLLVVVRENKDGTLLWNVMQSQVEAMNKNRAGLLAYRRE